MKKILILVLLSGVIQVHAENKKWTVEALLGQPSSFIACKQISGNTAYNATVFWDRTHPGTTLVGAVFQNDQKIREEVLVYAKHSPFLSGEYKTLAGRGFGISVKLDIEHPIYSSEIYESHTTSGNLDFIDSEGAARHASLECVIKGSIYLILSAQKSHK